MIIHPFNNGGDTSQGYLFAEGQLRRTFHDRTETLIAETDDDQLGLALAQDLAANRLDEGTVAAIVKAEDPRAERTAHLVGGGFTPTKVMTDEEAVLVAAYEKFLNAAADLDIAIEGVEDEGENCATEYPFAESFDDTVYRISAWINASVARLKGEPGEEDEA